MKNKYGVLLCLFGLLASLLPSLAKADVLPRLPQKASPGAIKFQPALDFDEDVCYYTAAVDEMGDINPGLPNKDQKHSHCRHPDRLENLNVYVRQRCNGGWCAYLYDYYAEMDNPPALSTVGGHRNEWEHVVVWTKYTQLDALGWPLDETISHVSTSAHGDFYTHHAKHVNWMDFSDGDGPNHPLIVVHHKGGLNASLRPAETHDMEEEPENCTGEWVRGDLVQMETIDKGLKKALEDADWGGPNAAVLHGLNDYLKDAMPKEAKGAFDPKLENKPLYFELKGYEAQVSNYGWYRDPSQIPPEVQARRWVARL
ncbi:NLP effector protein 3 [Pseudocercospora fuligena]|uniref:NLP effector protein 3 n=1 Tax=Pseudocercospora fuligena TaxID=685502 RepID=A0A8H6RRZ1_9PEZI|nr:NLP effector protein 3 [Pseudocercospora fuligena]